jgi:nicotinamide phosphoribosyltransferase
MQQQAAILKDYYKADHRNQYEPGTSFVYGNGTFRKSRVPGSNHVVWFGMQFVCMESLIDTFKRNFFDVDRTVALQRYSRIMDNTLGKGVITTEHLSQLHDLGFLPIRIKALKEGTLVPMGIPCFTICNTHGADFFWVTNYLETLISAELWMPTTSATTAHLYRLLLERYCRLTGGVQEFVAWQAHDFSMRGMASVDAARKSGGAHLLSSFGTDTIPAIEWLENYYEADVEKELVGSSVFATEHSVMCMGIAHNEAMIQSGVADDLVAEFESFQPRAPMSQNRNRLIAEYAVFKRLIEHYPSEAIVSIVSDTFDLFGVCTEILPRLKESIMARKGKIVIRPDSGDPIKIIVGDSSKEPGSPEYKGLIELLWETFGGTITEKGFKQLDPHIGAIYGDSITVERCEAICRGLMEKGFTSTNMVFGIGSFTYQYATRDTYGFAVKATYGTVNGEDRELFKDPKTDDGTKRSAKGLLMVYRDESGQLRLKDQCMPEEEQQGLLELVFEDGKMIRMQSLSEIRARLSEQRESILNQTEEVEA